MKLINKSLLAAALIAPAAALTGCIEETFPTTVLTQTQVNSVPTAADAYVAGMPAYLNTIFVVPGERHWDFGYPSIMKIRDIFTADTPHVPNGYFQFSRWETNENQGEDYIFGQMIWWYYSKQVQTSNLAIGVLPAEPTTPKDLANAGYAYAFRAFAYLDMARMYEYLPTDGTDAVNKDGNNVTNYTVPIVTESMDEAQARNNPRVKRDVMFDFIMGDLNKAEAYLANVTRASKTFPDLAVVYGLKARAYMWVEDYANAQVYARKAIDTFGGKPTTKEKWLSTTSGFNDITCPSWMWGGQYTSQDDAVKTGIINWTSWASNEYIGGYLSAGPYMMIDAKLYSQIDDRDFRKLSYVAPKDGALAGQEVFINKDALMSDPQFPVKIASTPYSSLKFRPGQGEMYDNTVGCACAYPLMRVEEMYLIEAEAAAQTKVSQGKDLIEKFMQNYRFADYKCTATDKQGIVDEIFKQKRIELWGEGQIFFDYKRLNKPVTRYYTGTNHNPEATFNTTTRPAWMNIVFVRQEADNNKGLVGWNNPNPTGVYPALAAQE